MKFSKLNCFFFFRCLFQMKNNICFQYGKCQITRKNRAGTRERERESGKAFKASGCIEMLAEIYVGLSKSKHIFVCCGPICDESFRFGFFFSSPRFIILCIFFAIRKQSSIRISENNKNLFLVRSYFLKNHKTNL